MAQDQPFDCHRDFDVALQKFWASQHLDQHFFLHLQVVPIAQVLLKLAEPEQDLGTAGDAQFVEDFDEVAQPPGRDSRAVERGRVPVIAGRGELSFVLVPGLFERRADALLERFGGQFFGQPRGLRQLVAAGAVLPRRCSVPIEVSLEPHVSAG